MAKQNARQAPRPAPKIMAIAIKRTIIYSLIALLALEPLLPFSPNLALAQTPSPSSSGTWDGQEINDSIGVMQAPFDSIYSSLDNLSSAVDEATLYGDLLNKNITYTGTDKMLLERLFNFSVDMEAYEKNHPGTIAAYTANGTIPQELIKKYSISANNPIPVLDKELADLLRNMVTDQALSINGVPGDGHTSLDISRLWKGYDSANKTTNQEGISDSAIASLQSQTESTHSLSNGEAVDIAGADSILCTQITYKTKNGKTGKITDKTKLPPIPIMFSSQVQNANNGNGFLGGFSPNPDGSIIANAMPALGVNFDDLLTKIPDPINNIINVLGDGGWSVGQSRLAPSIGAGFDPRNYKDDIAATTEGLFRDNLAGSQYADQLPLTSTTGLAGTVDNTGAAIIQQHLLPNVPASVFGGSTMTSWSTAYAREQLGSKLLGSGISLLGDTADQLWGNLGRTYAITRIFRLDPTDGYLNLPFDTAQHIRQSLGRLAVTERIGGALNSLASTDAATVRSAMGTAFDQPDLTDQRLNLAAGTTARFGKGQLSPDQYFESVGQAVVDQTVNAYPNDPTVRQMAYGLGVYFAGPEDVFLPQDTPARLLEIQNFYRNGPINMISNTDWADFVHLYYRLYHDQPSVLIGMNVPGLNLSNRPLTGTLAGLDSGADTLTAADRDVRLQTALQRILHDPTDFMSQIIGGQMGNTQWVQLGELVLARALTSQPFQQLAFVAYLRDPNHTVWSTRVSVPSVNDPNTILTAPTVTIGTDGRPVISGGQAVPVFSPDQLMNVIGLSQTDLTYIENDLFNTLVLPRVANDAFLEATGNSTLNSSLSGQSRAPVVDDTFQTATLQSILEQVPNKAQFSQFRQALSQLGPKDWVGSPDDSQGQKIQEISISLAKQFQGVASQLSASQRAQITNLLATFAAGRNVGDLYNLTPPSTFVPDASDGITQQFANDLYAGKISPDQAKQTIGVQYYANQLFDPSDPKQFASDLTNALTSSNQTAATNSFYNKYQSTFTNLAQQFTGSLDYQGASNFGGQQIFQTLSGNHLPLFIVGGALMYEATTGMKGNIFASNNNFKVDAGLRAVFDSTGLVGQLPKGSGDDIIQGITSAILDQQGGITWAKDRANFVLQNPHLLEALGAPQKLIDQFHAAYNVKDPTSAIQFLRTIDWNNKDIGKTLQSSLGLAASTTAAAKAAGGGAAAAPAIVAAVGAMFTKGGPAANILKPIQLNIKGFMPDVTLPKITLPKGITTSDLTNIYSEIQSNNTTGLASTLAGMSKEVAGREAGTYASLAATIYGDHSNPTQVVSESVRSLGNLYGLKNADQFANLTSTLGGFFTGQQTATLATVTAAGVAAAQAFGIKVSADVTRFADDPKGFGIALIAKKMSTVYGVPYDTTRQAMMGLASGQYVQTGQVVAAKLFSDSSVAKSLDKYSPGAKDKIVAALTSADAKTALIQTGQSLAYGAADKEIGLNTGFTQTMVTGTGDQKINALLDNADKLWKDMPPEGTVAIDIIKSRGDLSQISSATWNYLDGKVSDTLGVAVPPGFFQGMAGVATGQESFEQFAVGLGAPYLTKAISGAIRDALTPKTPAPQATPEGGNAPGGKTPATTTGPTTAPTGTLEPGEGSQKGTTAPTGSSAPAARTSSPATASSSAPAGTGVQGGNGAVGGTIAPTGVQNNSSTVNTSNNGGASGAPAPTGTPEGGNVSGAPATTTGPTTAPTGTPEAGTGAQGGNGTASPSPTKGGGIKIDTQTEIALGSALVGSVLDHQLGLPAGTMAGAGLNAYNTYNAVQAVDAAQNDFHTYLSNPDQYRGNLKVANANLGAAEAASVGFVINLAFGKQISQFEHQLGLPPGTMNLLLNAGLQAAFTGGSFAAALGAALPMFGAVLVAGYLFSALGIDIPILSGLLGGGEKSLTQTVCSGGGYYPYITPDQDKDATGNQLDSIYDPNSDLGNYKPISQRMKPDEVIQKLGLWPGYPGEFVGQGGIPEQNAVSFAIGQKASTRWKIRQVIGELLNAPAQFGTATAGGINPQYQLRQIIAYDIRSAAPGEISSDPQFPNDGDYLLPYDSRFSDSTFSVTDKSDPRYNITNYYPAGLKQAKAKPSDENDPRFVTTNAAGDKVGILDWPIPEISSKLNEYSGSSSSGGTMGIGYGDGSPGSMWADQQAAPGEYNRGMWLEKSADFATYIHASF